MSEVKEAPDPSNPSSDRSSSAGGLEALRTIVASGVDAGNATAALEATLDGIKLKHGALLAYDSDLQCLSLIAQRSLSPEAQAAMRSIRRGIAGAWDMPLHSLLQRRVYMIERPKENPFVPVLLEGSDQNVLSNIVFLPLYSAGTASGVLLLAGSGARLIREPDIVALREYAKLLGAALARSASREDRRAPEPGPAPPPATGPAFDRAELTARITELEALVQSLRKVPTATPVAPEADRRFADVARERDRLRADLSAREIDLVNLKAEVELLRDRSAQEAERSRKIALELAQAKEQLTGVIERERQVGEERGRIDRTRSELEIRVQGLERRLAKSAEHAKETQAERAALSMRAAEAETEAVELRKSLAARETQAQELRAERDRLAASLSTAASRAQESLESLTQLREDSTEKIAELQTRLEATEQRVQAAERERDQFRAGATGHAAIVEEIERETQAIRSELAREADRRRAAEETSASVIRDAASLREDLDRVQSEKSRLEASLSELRSANERLTADLDGARSGTEGLGGTLKEAQNRVVELERGLTEAERERGEVDAENQRLLKELEARGKREEEILARLSAGDSDRKKADAEIERLQGSLTAFEGQIRSLTRERDAVATRAGTLESKIEGLLRDGESATTERIQREEEAERLRAVVLEKDSELATVRAEIDLARAESGRLQELLAERESAGQSEGSLRRELEKQIDELRRELERAQALGSRLTEDLEKRSVAEDELRQANARLEGELERQRERLRADGEERQAVTARLREMEEVLRGASPDIAPQAKDLDAISMLRATLEGSEAARRAAEEGIERLQAELKSERQATAEARAQVEAERQETRDLAAQVEELSRRMSQAETATKAATLQAEGLAQELAASEKTSRSLATELGHRTAEFDALTETIRAREHEVGETRAAGEQMLERIRSLEEAARASAAEIASLKRRNAAADEDKEKLAHEHELRITEANARGERLEEQLAAAGQERERLLESIAAFEKKQGEQEESLRAATAAHAEAHDRAIEERTQNEKHAAEIESVRRQIESLEGDLRAAKAETEKWQKLNETLQRNVEERDRDLTGLRGAIAAMRKAKPGPAEAPPAPAQAPAPASAAAPQASAPPRTPAVKPETQKPAPVEAPGPEPGRTVIIFDDKGPSSDSLSTLCRKAGLEPQIAGNGAELSEPPQLIAVNLLATSPQGFDAIRRSRTEAAMKSRPIVLYAAKPGSAKGVALANVDCLIRPVDEAVFTGAVSSMIGGGKRITIIGEELDSVLKLNGWANATGCSVSSAGDLKQGSDLLDIVKPDLIVFDFSRLGGEGAGLIVKVRRSQRLAELPLLIVLPPPGANPATGLFLKRLTTLAEETPLDLSKVAERLTRGSTPTPPAA